MRVALLGPGAIGGAVGGTIAGLGHEVEFCVRTAFDTVCVERPGELIEAPATCRLDPAEIAGEFDAVGRVQVGSDTGRLTVPVGGERLADVLAGSWIDVAVVEDWVTPAWRKLMMNAALGGVGTLASADNRVFDDDDARDLAIALMHEVAEVARGGSPHRRRHTREDPVHGPSECLRACEFDRGRPASRPPDRVGGAQWRCWSYWPSPRHRHTTQ